MLESALLTLKMSRQQRGYEKLPATPTPNTHPYQHAPRNSWLVLRLFQLTTAILAISTATLGTLYLKEQQKHLSAQNDGGLLTCGQSVAEARSRGCHFDLISKSWLPEPCSRFGTDEFLAAGAASNNKTDNDVGSEMKTWTYWTAQEGGREIGLDELAELADRNAEGVRWWSTRREHSVHCAWMLLRLAHAYSNGLRGDDMMRDYGHQRHCVMRLLAKSAYAPREDEIATQGNVNFGSC